MLIVKKSFFVNYEPMLKMPLLLVLDVMLC